MPFCESGNPAQRGARIVLGVARGCQPEQSRPPLESARAARQQPSLQLAQFEGLGAPRTRRSCEPTCGNFRGVLRRKSQESRQSQLRQRTIAGRARVFPRVYTALHGGFVFMTKTSNAGAGVARYLRVYTVLSQALAEGSIAAGAVLPSEPTLVREYAVSRTTVRRALARLAAEGSIVRRRGSGTFARGRIDRIGSARRLAPILDDLSGLASNTTTRLLVLETMQTPDLLRREWPEFGRTIVTIRGVRYVKGQPVALVTTYVPEEIGRQLTPRRLGNDAVLVALE